MQSKTFCFNTAIYRNWLRRYWPVWGVQILIWLMLLPIPLLNAGGGIFGGTAARVIRATGSYGGILINAVFGCIAAMVSFSWMYNARSTAFAAALPLKREEMYCSCWLAGFSMLALPALVTALLSLLACLTADAEAAAAVLRWLAQDLLLALLFFGFASLCAQLTGTMWALPAGYTVLNFAVVAYWFLIAGVLDYLLRGYDMDVPDLAAMLSPPVWLFELNWEAAHFDSWTALGLYALFGAACAVCGLLLFRRRRMESATDTVAVNVLKPVFRWCAAVAAALGLGLLLYSLVIDREEQPLPMTLFMLLGGLIGWLAAEMIARKSYRVRSCLKTFPIFAAVIAAFGVGIGFGGFGYVMHIPEPDAVQELVVNYGGSYMTLTDPAEITQLETLHSRLASEKNEGYGSWLELNYVLKNGNEVHRSYQPEALTDAEAQLLFTLFQQHALEELDKLMSQARGLDVEVWDFDGGRNSFYLGAAQYKSLYNAIRSDVADGTLNLDGGWSFENAFDSEREISVSWSFYGLADDYKNYMYFRVTPDAKRCWALLKEFGAATAGENTELR